MTEAPFQFNCIGFVRHRLGLDKIERFVDSPELPELLADFKVVCDTAPAVAIAVQHIRMKENYLGDLNLIYYISHMAVIDPANPGMIFHRRGIDRPISHDPIVRGLKFYTFNPSTDTTRRPGESTHVMYLQLRSNTLSSGQTLR